MPCAYAETTAAVDVMPFSIWLPLFCAELHRIDLHFKSQKSDFVPALQRINEQRTSCKILLTMVWQKLFSQARYRLFFRMSRLMITCSITERGRKIYLINGMTKCHWLLVSIESSESAPLVSIEASESAPLVSMESSEPPNLHFACFLASLNMRSLSKPA